MIEITVTDDDIDEGKLFSCDACPLAIAASRAVKKHVQVYYSIYNNERFNGWLVWRKDETHYYRIKLSTTVIKWLRAFDEGRGAKAFSMNVELPSE